jgi:hypothetical protein
MKMKVILKIIFMEPVLDMSTALQSAHLVHFVCRSIHKEQLRTTGWIFMKSDI